MNIIYVSNRSKSVVKQARDAVEARKIAAQLSAVYDEEFVVCLNLKERNNDVWALNYDR